MRRVPWITLAIAVIVFVSPPTLKLIRSAFFSGEQLARTLSQFILEVALATAVAFIFIEWGVRFYLSRRNSRRTPATPHE
jgi:ribose/xylose/arabinose/galactoside ABC-type transport system permease subunit